jgi:hypothetical protein
MTIRTASPENCSPPVSSSSPSPLCPFDQNPTVQIRTLIPKRYRPIVGCRVAAGQPQSNPIQIRIFPIQIQISVSVQIL